MRHGKKLSKIVFIGNVKEYLHHISVWTMEKRLKQVQGQNFATYIQNRLILPEVMRSNTTNTGGNAF